MLQISLEDNAYDEIPEESLLELSLEIQEANEELTNESIKLDILESVNNSLRIIDLSNTQVAHEQLRATLSYIGQEHLTDVVIANEGLGDLAKKAWEKTKAILNKIWAWVKKIFNKLMALFKKKASSGGGGGATITSDDIPKVSNNSGIDIKTAKKLIESVKPNAPLTLDELKAYLIAELGLKNSFSYLLSAFFIRFPLAYIAVLREYAITNGMTNAGEVINEMINNTLTNLSKDINQLDNVESSGEIYFGFKGNNFDITKCIKLNDFNNTDKKLKLVINQKCISESIIHDVYILIPITTLGMLKTDKIDDKLSTIKTLNERRAIILNEIDNSLAKHGGLYNETYSKLLEGIKDNDSEEIDNPFYGKDIKVNMDKEAMNVYTDMVKEYETENDEDLKELDAEIVETEATIKMLEGNLTSSKEEDKKNIAKRLEEEKSHLAHLRKRKTALVLIAQATAKVKQEDAKYL